MLTALCNIFIDSDQKFSLFRETFPRVYPISDNWLISIRGRKREQVLDYIRTTFPDWQRRCILFPPLMSRDWAKSTRHMLTKSRYDYIYLFLEDHFLLQPLTHFQEVVRETIESKIDYLSYSFFSTGISPQSSAPYRPIDSRHLVSFTLVESILPLLRKLNPAFYPYSLASIVHKPYFERLLAVERGRLIYLSRYVQALMANVILLYPKNRIAVRKLNEITRGLNIRFTLYPPATPFNLERSLVDIEPALLPLRIGLLKKELFANWDDDNGRTNASLIKRGLYPATLVRPDFIPIDTATAWQQTLAQGEQRTMQYYPEIGRPPRPPLKSIRLDQGAIRLTTSAEQHTLKSGDSLTLHANIPHTMTGLEDSKFTECLFPEGV